MHSITPTAPRSGFDVSILRRFLLNDLPEDRRLEIEESLVEDDALFEDLCLIEDEMCDELAAGELHEDEARALRRRLERFPRGRLRLTMHQELKKAADRRYGFFAGLLADLSRLAQWLRAAPPFPALAFQAALLLLVAGPLLFFASDLKQEAESLKAELGTFHAKRDTIAGLLTPTEWTFELPRALRATGYPTLYLPYDIPKVRLVAPLAEIEAGSVQAEILLDGRRIWEQSGLRVRTDSLGSIVELEVPREILASGLHEIEILPELNDKTGPAVRILVMIRPTT